MTNTVPFVEPPASESNSTPPPAPAEEQPAIETKSPLEEDAEESSKFRDAKAKAVDDQAVKDLEDKADSATGDDAKGAMKAYYKALYDKMREIDPSIKDRIDRTEAASMRRVDAESQ